MNEEEVLNVDDEGKGKRLQFGEDETLHIPEETAYVEEKQQDEHEEEEHQRKDTYFEKDRFEEYMAEGNKALETLMEKDLITEAAQVKQILDVCYSLQIDLKHERQNREELLPEIDAANFKLVESLNLTATAQEIIKRLKNALEDSWRQIDASHSREQDYQEEIRELYEKCKKMSDSIPKDVDGDDLGRLSKHKQVILRERDRLNGEVIELERRLQLQRFYGETLEKMCQTMEDDNRQLRQTVENMETEETKMQRKMFILKNEIDEAQTTNKNLLKRAETYEKQVEEQMNKIMLKSKEIEWLKVKFETLRRERNTFKKELSRLKKIFNACINDKDRLNTQIKNYRTELTGKSNELTAQKRQNRELIAESDRLRSKIQKLDKQIFVFKAELDKSINNANIKEKIINSQMKEQKELIRQNEQILRERDDRQSDITKLKAEIGELNHMLMMRNSAISKLNLEIEKQISKHEEAKKLIARVEKERDYQSQEVEVLSDKFEACNEDIQLKAAQITDLQNSITEKQTNYIKIQQLLESTNSERLKLQRALQSCSEERNSLKNLQSVTTHQMTQLTEEITSNQNKINVLNLQLEKLQQEKQKIYTELSTTKKLLSSTRADLKDVKTINDKLQNTIQEDEFRFMQLAHTLEETRKEKNLVGLQMVRRNDEIALVRERLDILQNAVDRGQIQYNQRIEDIRLLKMEILKLRTQCDVLRRGISNTVNMRRELIRLQRRLDQECIESRALKEDLKVPVNVHRWRILRGSDPDRYALVQKIRFLQKRLLFRFVEGVQREQKLQNCHHLYISLKRFVDKLPGYKVKEDFVKCQRVLRTREKKMKALTAELNARDLEVKTRDCKIDELTTNLIKVKKDLFNERKLTSKLQAKEPIPLKPSTVCSL